MNRLILLVLVLVTSLSLSACGNQTDRGVYFKAVRQGLLTKPAAAAPLPTPEQLQATIATALGNTDKRLAIAVVERRNSFTFLTEVQRNGQFGTWGSPDKRTVTKQNGMISATRGLGFDLMASENDAVLALVTTRKSGKADRTLFYLDGQNQETAYTFSCDIKRGGSQGISIGEVRATTIVMSETCSSSKASFENTYLVDARGRIVQSRQWLGARNGYITVQALRL